MRVLRFFGLTDVGRKRSDNEDRFAVSNERQFAILADGMGGRLYGEVASEMTVKGLSRRVLEDMPSTLGRLDAMSQGAMVVNLLDEWIRDVNLEVFDLGQRDERYREMGTTLVALVGLGHHVVLGHVGDSRCYRFNGAGLAQLTEDHSFVNSQVKQGVLTEDQARESSQKNIITRAVGTAERVKPEVRVYPAHVNDRFLLCSDGLTDMVPNEGISAILEVGEDLETAAQRLVDAANTAGGRDNITVILAEMV